MIVIDHIINVKGHRLQLHVVNWEVMNDLYFPELTATN